MSRPSETTQERRERQLADLERELGYVLPTSVRRLLLFLADEWGPTVPRMHDLGAKNAITVAYDQFREAVYDFVDVASEYQVIKEVECPGADPNTLESSPPSATS